MKSFFLFSVSNSQQAMLKEKKKKRGQGSKTLSLTKAQVKSNGLG